MSAQAPAPASPAAPTRSFAESADDLRRALDAVCDAEAPPKVSDDLIADMYRLSSLLRSYLADGAGEARRSARCPGSDSESHPLVPPIVITEALPEAVRAAVTFRREHVGSGDAVHGGFVPLVYDDVLGRLAQRVTPTVARTAYLRVDFRAVTPVEQPVVVEGGITRIEGRKIHVWGRMLDGESVLTTADALFVTARPERGC